MVSSVDTFLTLDAVKQATGLGRSTIYDLMGGEPASLSASGQDRWRARKGRRVVGF